MSITKSQKQHQELHVDYPDESVTEEIYQFAYDEILKKIPKNKIVLDVGCGTGTLVSRISEFSKEVIGIDIIEERIEKAKAISRKENVRFHVSDAYSLPLNENSIDVIVSVGVFHHLELSKITPELKRVLRKGGTIFIIDMYEGFQRPSARIKSCIKMLQRDGTVKTFSVFMKMFPIFFREKNKIHRKNDKERMIKVNTYTFQGFKTEYSKYFKGCICGEDVYPYVYCYYVDNGAA